MLAIVLPFQLLPEPLDFFLLRFHLFLFFQILVLKLVNSFPFQFLVFAFHLTLICVFWWQGLICVFWWLGLIWSFWWQRLFLKDDLILVFVTLAYLFVIVWLLVDYPLWFCRYDFYLFQSFWLSFHSLRLLFVFISDSSETDFFLHPFFII